MNFYLTWKSFALSRFRTQFSLQRSSQPILIPQGFSFTHLFVSGVLQRRCQGGRGGLSQDRQSWPTFSPSATFLSQLPPFLRSTFTSTILLAFYILCARSYFQQQELEETTVQSSNICMTQVKENTIIFCFELGVIYCQFLHGKNWAQNMSWIALRQNSNRDLGTAPPCEHSMDWILNPNREFSNILKGWLPRGEY